MEENEIGKSVVDVAVQIHRDLGHGLLETVYESYCYTRFDARGCR